MFADGRLWFDGDVQIVFVKTLIIRGGFCFSLGGCGGTSNTAKASRPESCVLREQRAYVSPEFGVWKKVLNIFLLI